MASDLIATRNSHSHLHSCRSQEHSKWRRNIKSKHAWFATQDFWPEPAAVFVGAFQGSLSISRHPVTPGGPTERGVPKNYANCRFHLMTWWMLQCYSYIISNIHITYCHILYAILVCVLKLQASWFGSTLPPAKCESKCSGPPGCIEVWLVPVIHRFIWSYNTTF